MSLFGMTKDAPPSAASSPAAATEKPLPAARPGTAGTENMLMMNRRQASEQLAKAQRAEQAYKAKKRAAAARAGYAETKMHFREALAHLRGGARGLVALVRAAPYLACEKREQWRRKGDAKKRARAVERKRRLEEALARQAEVDAGAGAGAADGDDDGGEDGEEVEKKARKLEKADRKKKKSAA
ncbi:hypothetical protein F4779DRAFT_638079 [Xylariaceae sp. FL0662B]|nr:hypothetical protein F4779DRAFT_638079 [Xylariaceae sp. FL0662B]